MKDLNGDLEKQEHPWISAGDVDTSAVEDGSETGDESPELRPQKTRRSYHSHETPAGSIAGSLASTDSDPYEEELERATSQGLDLTEEEAARAAHEPISRVRTGTSVESAASRPSDFEVFFEVDDTQNPKNWPLWYRVWVIFSVSFSCWVVVLYSTSYTAAVPGLMEEYHESNQTLVTLGLTTYLLGLAAGTLVVAPMSELYGRRPVYLVCMFLFVLLVIPTCVATSLNEILVVRFFGAAFGSALVSNSPGTIVDITNEEYLALYISLFSVAPMNAPVSGSVIGGFVFQYLGWRWDSWLALILGCVAILVMATVKETYAPIILQKRAAQRRKELDDDRWWCRYDEKISKLHLLRVNLNRPFVLSLTEPILWFFNIWISLIYGILYLCFVAYPIVFSQHRGWAPGPSGLAFVGIGIGTLIAIACEPLWRRIIKMHAKDPETGKVAPEATASIMCIGSLLTPIGQLGFSWTCLPETIHWAVPIAFGIPFGIGNTLAFIYGSNYLAGAYGIYAASALAGNTVARSIFGATLPLAGPAMYEALTPQWAGTLLGLMEVCLIPIPFAFYRYGAKIRSKSRVIRQMREDQAKNESRRSRLQQRRERRAIRERGAAGVGVVNNNAEHDETTNAGVFKKDE